MRHQVSKRLGRHLSLRKATLRDIAKATLVHERICTTKAKAREARKLVDRLITLGKKGTLSAKRRAFSILCDHMIVSNLFEKTAPRFKSRIGGYTRIIPLALRRGDGAFLVFLELTEKAVIVAPEPKTKEETKAQLKAKEALSKKEVKSQEVKTEEKEIPRKDETPKRISPKVLGGLQKIFRKKTP